MILLCNKKNGAGLFVQQKGVKNGAVAALASDYFLMVDRLILPMALKTMKEKVDHGTLPAGLLKKNHKFQYTANRKAKIESTS